MSRLTPVEQRAYEQEVDYQQRGGGRPSAMDRIVATAKGAYNYAHTVNGRMEDGQFPVTADEARRVGRAVVAGARTAREAGHAVGEGIRAAGESSGARDWAQRTNTGFNAYQPPQAAQRVASPQVPVVAPGNRLYVIQGSMIATGGGMRGKLRRRGEGGGGGIEARPGFGNDPGM